MIAVEGYLGYHRFPGEPAARHLADATLPAVEEAATIFLLEFSQPKRGEVVLEEGSTKVRRHHPGRPRWC